MDESKTIEYRKTVSEADVYLFAGITGDFSPVHVDAQRMAESEVGERIAHGVLVTGLMSAASSRWCETYYPKDILLSYGYERVRFIRPVRFGDTIAISVVLSEERPDKRQLVCDVQARNQHGDVVGIATHLLSFGAVSSKHPG